MTFPLYTMISILKFDSILQQVGYLYIRTPHNIHCYILCIDSGDWFEIVYKGQMVYRI